MSNGNGHRWSKFWWQDWQNDEALRMCSLAAQGLWMRMLCIMHGAKRTGYLLVSGKPPTNQQLAALVGASVKEIGKLSEELEAACVFSRESDGTIYNRRMCKDAALSDAGKTFGKAGGNPSLVPKPNGVDPNPIRGGVNPPPYPTSQPLPLTGGVGRPLNLEAEAEKETEAEKDKEESEEVSKKDFKNLTSEVGCSAREPEATPASPAAPHDAGIALGNLLRMKNFPPRDPVRSPSEQSDAVAPRTRLGPKHLTPEQLAVVRQRLAGSAR